MQKIVKSIQNHITVENDISKIVNYIKKIESNINKI